MIPDAEGLRLLKAQGARITAEYGSSIFQSSANGLFGRGIHQRRSFAIGLRRCSRRRQPRACSFVGSNGVGANAKQGGLHRDDLDFLLSANHTHPQSALSWHHATGGISGSARQGRLRALKIAV